MKKLSAIFFLFIIALNLCGYQFMLARMQNANADAIEKQVDEKQYSDNELISIKTKLELPYYVNSAEYERAFGSVTIDGKDYEYVKRRVYHDTLELLCLPNHAKTKLQSVSNDLAKANADGQASPTKKSGSTIKLSMPDFFQSNSYCSDLASTSIETKFILSNISVASTDYTLTQERPPCVRS